MKNVTPELARLAFPFTEEQLLIYDSVKSFSRDRLGPGAAARDKSHEFPLEEVGELAEMGMLAMRVPMDYGGSESDMVSYVLAMEAIGEYDGSMGAIVASSNLSAKIIADMGNEEQKKKWLEPFAQGKLGPISFALTEPGTGSDAGGMKTTAVQDGDSFVLNGAKMWITSGSVAGLHLVFAKTAPDKGSHGVSIFLVEKDTPGLEVGKEEEKMGLTSSGTVGLFFEDCRIPKENLIGPLDRGYSVALEALGAGRVGIAGQCIGLAEAAMREGVGYAMERKVFGRRVVDYQYNQFKIADCRMELDSAWLVTLRAAALVDRKQKAVLETSMAKVKASEALDMIVDQMLQLHGGYGYSREYTIERLYRDARITRIYEGTNEIQRMLMSRELLGTAGQSSAK